MTSGTRFRISGSTRSAVTSVLVAGGAAVMAAALGGCAASASTPTWPPHDGASHLSAADLRGIEACQDAMESVPRATPANALDAMSIDLVNWNMKKKSLPNWREDYVRLTQGKDLILLQEASLRADTINDLPAVPYWSFAPGYQSSDAVSGVLTLSSVEPVTRCSFVTAEPVLRSPKATSITQFLLQGHDVTLLVVNLHAVNFSLGLESYERQFEQIAGILAGHDGPVILSGDMNTWREARMQTVRALAEAYGLTPLEFADGHRSLFFGRPVDHIYVRGLTATAIRSTSVTSSDHNPLSVTLSM